MLLSTLVECVARVRGTSLAGTAEDVEAALERLAFSDVQEIFRRQRA